MVERNASVEHVSVSLPPLSSLNPFQVEEGDVLATYLTTPEGSASSVHSSLRDRDWFASLQSRTLASIVREGYFSLFFLLLFLSRLIGR